MWREILQSIQAHKERSILTGIGIAWGMFILVILLGLGKGFENGILQLFSSFNQKTVWVFCGQTSEPYKGLKAGRKINLKYHDIYWIKKNVKGIESISPEITHWGGSLLTYKDNYSSYNIKAVDPQYFDIKLLETTQGRVLSNVDSRDKRRVALIGENVAEVLFKNTQAVGKILTIDGNYFKVVGIIKNSLLNAQESREVYIPYACYTDIYSNNKYITTFLYSTKEGINIQDVQSKIKLLLARQYIFNPKDDKTIFFNTLDESVKSFEKLSIGIQFFLWFVGISTLLSGVIGIGNIMFVIVKERTKEIGIRKAIGAKPHSIRLLILYEAIFFTLISGIVGMLSGMVLLQIFNIFLEKADIVIKDTAINVPISIAALIILIISGTCAGLIPANKAARISPIHALKDE